MPKNALDALDSIIADEGSRWEMLHRIGLNIHSITYGKPLSMEQLLNYFVWFREGVVLIRDLLGEQVIPSSIRFFEDPRAVMRGLFPDFVGYVPEWDAIAIGVASIVDDAWVAGPHDLIRPKYPGMPEFIWARTNIMLVAMEECFHRYQKRVLRRPHEQGTYALSDHPIEVEWRAYRDELIRTGVITIRPAHEA